MIKCNLYTRSLLTSLFLFLFLRSDNKYLKRVNDHTLHHLLNDANITY